MSAKMEKAFQGPLNKLFAKGTAALLMGGLLVAGPATAAEIKFKSSGGLKWEVDDGSASGQFGGRVMADYNYFDDDELDHESGAEFRRLRLFGKAQFLEYEAKVQIDFAGSDVDLKDAYIARKMFGGKAIVGHFKQPFGLEELTSSKYITFIERAFNGIPTSRKMGAGYSYATDHNTFTVGAYDPVNIDGGDADFDAIGYGARATWAPHAENGNVTHFGIAAASETEQDQVRIRPRISHLASRVVVLDVADTNNVDVTKAGLEAALVRGPFSAQAEYHYFDVDSSGQAEAVNAYYVYGSWFLTGDVRPYKAKSGAFDRVKPINRDGAWEVALRYDYLENDDTDGEAEAWMAGLNYYANAHVRWMLNVIVGDMTDTTGTVNDQPTAVVARWQLDF